MAPWILTNTCCQINHKKQNSLKFESKYEKKISFKNRHLSGYVWKRMEKFCPGNSAIEETHLPPRDMPGNLQLMKQFILKVRLHGTRQAARLACDMLQCDLPRGNSVYMVGSCHEQLLHIIYASPVFEVGDHQRKLLATACAMQQLKFKTRSPPGLAAVKRLQREREREIKIISLFGDRGHRGPYSPYKLCNHNLYIGIIIFPHIDNPQSTGCVCCEQVCCRVNVPVVCLCCNFAVRLSCCLSRSKQTQCKLAFTLLSVYKDMFSCLIHVKI